MRKEKRGGWRERKRKTGYPDGNKWRQKSELA